MKALCFALLALALSPLASRAATFGTFRTSLGNLEVQFLDEDKPVTVSNFLKYATSGRFKDEFIQRWVPGFVIQAGGYRVTDSANGSVITAVEKAGSITNEFSVGPRYSNTFGTIAMARVQGQTNSASSEWFINLSDANTFLDNDSGGFTVFAKVTGGTNLLNLFVPGPTAPGGTNIYGLSLFNLGGALSTIPVLNNPPTYNDLIYIDISLWRDVGLKIQELSNQRLITWNSVTGLTNIVEYSTPELGTNWTALSTQTGTGAPVSVRDLSADSRRFYRVKLVYPAF